MGKEGRDGGRNVGGKEGRKEGWKEGCELNNDIGANAELEKLERVD